MWALFRIRAYVLLAACAAPIVLADGFLSSCDSNTIEIDGTILTAYCTNIVKDMTCSRLDLGRCLRNDYGSIQDDPVGEGYVQLPFVEFHPS